MSERRYIISDAAKMINVEPHVLRYWEEELGMEIPRNEMGHRYYTDYEVKIFTQVRDLKDKGFQLKAIKMILSTLSEEGEADNIISIDKARKPVESLECGDEQETQLLPETMKADSNESEDKLLASAQPEKPAMTSDEKMQHFRYIMDNIVTQALKKNNDCLEEQITGKVLKEMDYMFRMSEEREEERFRTLDESIRKKQRGRREAAAAKIPSYVKPQPKKRFFGKKEIGKKEMFW